MGSASLKGRGDRRKPRHISLAQFAPVRNAGEVPLLLFRGRCVGYAESLFAANLKPFFDSIGQQQTHAVQ